MILAIDTTLPLLSLALVEKGGVIASVSSRAEGSRNEKLLPAIDWMLAEAGISMEEVGLIAVTRGPGSFTGARIGLATVQGLALAKGMAVCAMGTLEAAASGQGEDNPVLVISEAGRGEFYAAAYRGLDEILAPSLLNEEALAFQAGRFETTLRVEEQMQTHNVAVLAARRAEEIASAGRLEQYRDLTPIYVRLAEAEVRLKQKLDAG